MSKAIFYGVMSLDGYIAGENDDMGWAERYLNPDEDYGWVELIQQCGALLMGRKTFEFELKTAPAMDRLLPTFVLTSQPLRFDGVHSDKLHFISGDLQAVVSNITAKHPGDLFIGGGAMLLEGMLAMDLVDELRLFIAPDILGSGTRLFKGTKVPSQFRLQSSKKYNSGLTQLHLVR